VRVGLVVVLGLSIAALAGCERLMSVFLPGFANQDVVLSDKPMVLGTEPTRFSAGEPLRVVGFTSDLCVVLADDVAKDADIDATYKSLKAGARLSAVLHASGGADVVWKCGGWSFSPGESGRGSLSACLRWECNQAPPKGTEIASIDLSADRPLRILGAHWSSTAAFDHVSQPPPDRDASSSAEYRDLEQIYGGKPAWSSPAQTSLQVELSSNRRRASSSTFNSTLKMRLATEGVQLQPGPNAIGMGIVTIPTTAVAACSMSCFGNLARRVNLLLPEPGIQVDLLNSPEVVNWCWQNRIPMATSAARRAWLYEGVPLPDKKSYAQQLSSRPAYDDQASQSCMGY
jgi:hypothetical protein